MSPWSRQPHAEGLGISQLALYRWKKRLLPCWGVTEVRQPRVLEKEKRKLKQLVVDLGLYKQMLQDVLRKYPWGLLSCGPARIASK